MNTNIRTIVLTVGAPILALIATMFLFTGKGNLVASGYKFYVPLFFVLCAFKPRVGLPFCILLTVIGDTVKRLMLYDSTVSEADIALVLLMVPAGIGGLIVYALVYLFNNWRSTHISIKLAIGFSMALAMLSVLSALSGGAGLRSLGDVLNSSLYFVFTGTLPLIFKSREDIINTLKLTILVFVPVALYGLKQAFWDYADFEYAYLESGLTIEIRQLSEKARRVMSTLSAAVALSVLCGCFAGLSFSTLALNQRMKMSFGSFCLKMILGTLFIVCTYYTFTRVGFLCCIVSFGVVFVLRSKALTVTAAITSFLLVITIYAMADTWLQDDLLGDMQERLVAQAEAGDVNAEQTMQVGTWNARLESMSNLLNKPEIWTPFGLKSAGKEDVIEGLWIHDPLSEILVVRGYVVLFIVLLVGIYVMVKLLQFHWSIPKGRDERLMRFLLAGGLGIWAAASSQGKALFVFPINLIWAFCFGGALTLATLIIRERKEQKEAFEEDPELSHE